MADNRRSFIKKGILGSFFIGSTYKSIGSSSIIDDIPEGPGGKTWEEIRQYFYLNTNRTYLNNGTLGPSPKAVVKAVQDAMILQEKECETYHGKLKDIRKRIGESLGADPSEIAITRNATEGVNIIARGLRLKKGDEVIITRHEHVGGASPWMALQKECGVKITLVDLSLDGEGNDQRILSAISKKTKVLFFSHVCCSNGMILPVKKICEEARKRNIYTCVDGAQAMGQLYIQLNDLAADFWVSSGHKWLMGPKGTGVLYVRKESLPSLAPTFVGAYTVKDFDLDKLTMNYEGTAHREEYGTRNTPVSIGLGEAFRFIEDIGQLKVQKRHQELSKRLVEGLSAIKQVEILSPFKEEYRSGIITFRLKNLDYKQLQKKLGDANFRVRGIYEAQLNGIRVSCGIYNGEDEIDRFVSEVGKIANS